MKDKLKNYAIWGFACVLFLVFWGGAWLIFQSGNLWFQSGILLLIGFALVRKAYRWYRDVYVFRSHIPKDLWSTEHDPETFTTFYLTSIRGHSILIEERKVLNELRLQVERGGHKFIWEVEGTNRWQLMAITPHIVEVVTPLVAGYKIYKLAGSLKSVFGRVLLDLKDLQEGLQASKDVAPTKRDVTKGSEIAHPEGTA